MFVSLFCFVFYAGLFILFDVERAHVECVFWCVCLTETDLTNNSKCQEGYLTLLLNNPEVPCGSAGLSIH